MQCHLRCIGEEYWKITKNVYNAPLNGPTTPDEIKEVEYNIRAKEAFLSGLSNFEMTNVMGLETAHKIWIKLETLHEGDSQVKISKLQRLKGKYENLEMSGNENITSLIQKVNELVCGIRCISGVLEESEIVFKY